MTAFRSQRDPLVPPGTVDHHVADLTFTASADCTLAHVQETLARNDQWLPIDGDPSQTVGRLVEINSTGPLRIGFGGWRDLLLGAQMKTLRGELITAGGRTMKNVAGYDLTKFLIGQHGLFASAVTITARTAKRPVAALHATFPANEELIGQLLPTPARPQYAMLRNDTLHCGYLGDRATIDFYKTEVQKWKPTKSEEVSLADDIAFRAANWMPARDDVRFRASVPPAKILAFTREAKLSDFAADACFGIVLGRCEVSLRLSVRNAAQSLGGSVAFDDQNDIASYFGAAPPVKNLLDRLRTSFGA